MTPNRYVAETRLDNAEYERATFLANRSAVVTSLMDALAVFQRQHPHVEIDAGYITTICSEALGDATSDELKWMDRDIEELRELADGVAA